MFDLLYTPALGILKFIFEPPPLYHWSEVVIVSLMWYYVNFRFVYSSLFCSQLYTHTETVRLMEKSKAGMLHVSHRRATTSKELLD